MRPLEEKIQSLPALQKTLEAEKFQGKRIVLCHGVFDLIHPGHILHLKAARQLGDVLVVTVTPDHYVHKGPGRPVFNEQLRVETIAALECVDYVAVNQWPAAAQTILMLKPDIYAKGHEYEDSASDITGNISEETAAIEKVGGKAVFTDEETYSSSTLINKFFGTFPPATEQYLRQFRSRHSANEIISILQGIAEIRVLVVGEAILDQYCYCYPLGKSPKETIVATQFVSEEHFAGGSLAIANHLAGFCRQVTLVTSLGSEPQHVEFITSKLRPNVQLCAVRTEDRPTIRKRRYLEPSFLTKMFEIQYLDDRPPSSDVEENVNSFLQAQVPVHDMVAVADYGHGFFTTPLRSMLCSSDKFLSLNTQTNSANLGFNPATKYTTASYLCIDEPELRMTYRTKYDDIKLLATQLCRQLKADRVMVTRGPYPSIIVSGDGSWFEAPVMSRRVVDRTGAGDALFAVTSPCAYKGASPEVIAFIGNCVGAMAVEIVCNREPIDPVMLYKFIAAILK